MPGPKPSEVALSEAEREELKALIRAHKTSQQIVFRVRIILLLAEGLTTTAGRTAIENNTRHRAAVATALD